MTTRIGFCKRFGTIVVIGSALLATPLTGKVNAEPGQKDWHPPYNVGFYVSNTARSDISEFPGIGFPVGSSRYSIMASVSIGRTVVPYLPLNRAGTVGSNLEMGVSLTCNYSRSRDATVNFTLLEVFGIIVQNTADSIDTITTNTSVAINAYTRWNVNTQSRFVPFLGALAGLNVARSKSVTDTESERISPGVGALPESTHTESSTGGTSASVGFQVGLNYFITDSLSFNCQYDRNIPLSDVPGLGVLSWGVRYWFSGK